jgi:hypothetical protein
VVVETYSYNGNVDSPKPIKKNIKQLK